MPPSTRWARVAASCDSPGSAAAWRPPSFRPSERNRPALKNHTFNYLDLVRYLAVGNPQPVAAGICRRIRCLHRRSPRRPPRDRLRRSTPFRVSGSACWRSCTPSTARSPLCHWGHGLPVASAVGRCSGTSNIRPRRKRLAGSTPRIKRCERIRLAAMNYLEVNQPPARYFGPNSSRLSAVQSEV